MTSQQPSTIILDTDSSKGSRPRSALGVGITTLVTVLVLLLMATFATLSLASARSDLALSKIAAQSVQSYYQADAQAVRWYAQLQEFAGGLSASSQNWEQELGAAGYQVTRTDAGELRVSELFAMGDKRQLVVTVAINNDHSVIIRQWQT